MIDSKKLLACELARPQFKQLKILYADQPCEVVDGTGDDLVDTNYFAAIINHAALHSEELLRVLHSDPVTQKRFINVKDFPPVSGAQCPDSSDDSRRNQPR